MRPQSTLEALLDDRASPESRSVLEDWERERFTTSTTSRLGFALFVADADAAAADDYPAAAADDYPADDYPAATATATVAAYADADGDTNADADAAYADAAADTAYRLSKLLLETPDMNDGLKLIQIPGRYGYSVTIVGWLRRVSGDEWEILPGARSVYRQSGQRNLASLAADGPQNDTGMLEPTKLEEHVHRLVIRRALVASETAWAEHIVKPSTRRDTQEV